MGEWSEGLTKQLAYIWGGGAQGRTVLDIFRAAGFSRIAFIDSDRSLRGTKINGVEVVGDLIHAVHAVHESDKNGCGVVIALGRPELRQKLAGQVSQSGLPFIGALHPLAFVAASALIGEGNMIAAQAVINSNASLGNHIIVNTAAVIEHDDLIGDFATICPGAQIGGRVTVGKGAFIGTGAIILPRVKIGEGAVVGAGSLVTRDVPARVLVYGSPARVISAIDSDFDFGRLL